MKQEEFQPFSPDLNPTEGIFGLIISLCVFYPRPMFRFVHGPQIDALGRKRDKLWRTTKNDGQDQQITQTNGWPEMIFEYDPEKSRTNKTKHGIDFEEAKAAWDDPNAVEFASEYGSEERLGRIARIYRFGSKVWTVIFTYRWPAIRIISVRRARKAEEETYERKHSEDSGGV